MLVPPRIFECHKLADSDSSRYALGGVRLERSSDGPATAIACDGRRLVVVEWDEAPAADYPADRVNVSLDHRPEFAAIVPIDACKRAVKLPGRSPKAILSNVAVDESASNGKVVLAATDLEEDKRITPRSLEGRYPKWREAFPRPTEPEQETVSVNLDCNLLRGLLETIEKVTGDRETVLTFTLHVDTEADGIPLAARARDGAVVITAHAGGVRVAGVIMPKDGPPSVSAPREPLLPEWVPSA